MSSLVEKTIRQALRREPTAEDYRQVNEMLSALPGEMRNSPGVVCEVVLRIEFLRKLEESIQQASWKAQQQIHADLPHRIDEAALRALSKMRSLMPTDASDAARRMLKTAALFVAVAALAAGVWGYVMGQYMTRRAVAARQTTIQAERSHCIDAAVGQLAVGSRSSSNPSSSMLATARNDLLACVSASEPAGLTSS